MGKKRELTKWEKENFGSLEELAQLISIGLNGEPTSDQAEKVRAWLAANPDELKRGEWLSKEAERKVVESATTWQMERERVIAQMEDIKTGLGYESSNLIERLAIDQVALSWARLYFLENNLSILTRQSHSRDSAQYWDRRITSAQNRYHQALIALAKIRKLKLPDITAIQAQNAYVSVGDGALDVQARKLITSGECDGN